MPLEDSHSGSNREDVAAVDSALTTYPKQMLNGPAIVLAARPGDEVFGCGEALCELVRTGQAVQTVIIGTSRGAVDPVGERPEALKSHAGLAASEAAAQILGSDPPVSWQGTADRATYTEHTISRLSAQIDSSGARIIYAPSTTEEAADRFGLAMAAREAVRRSPKPCFLAAYSLSAQRCVGNEFQVYRSGALKRRALKCFQSSDGDPPESSVQENENAWGVEQYDLVPSAALIQPVTGLSARDSWEPMETDHGLPLVSIVTRSTNRPELADAMDSVAGQTYRNIELLLVDVQGDGGLSLSTAQRCGPFPARVVSTGCHLNRGAAANAGLAAARGDYVLFLDDDDWLHSDHVHSLVETIRSNEEARAAYSQTVCVMRSEAEHWDILSYYKAPYDPTRLLVENFLPIHSVLFDRSLVDEQVRFDETLDVYEDWDFWIQLSQLVPFFQTDRVTAVYRISETSGFGRRGNDPAAASGYRAVIGKWRELWSAEQLDQIARDAANDRRSSETKTRAAALGEMEGRIAIYAERVAQLTRLTLSQNAQISTHDQEIASRDDRIVGLTRELEEQKSAVARLTKEAMSDATSRAELVRLKNELLGSRDRLQTSAYWQLSRPLRAANSRWPRAMRGVAAAPKLVWWTLTLRLGRRLSIGRLAKQILVNGLFDRAWYIEQNPDIVMRDLNPVLHWLVAGWREGRYPNALFHTDWYLNEYPDVAVSDVNPLLDYLESGVTNGRDPCSLFHSSWYLMRYPDVADAGANPLGHYLTIGVREGRDPNALFDTDWYLAQNADVAAAGMNPLDHYIRTGAEEGRDPNPFFDTDWYLAQNPDVASQGMNPLAHYFCAGAKEGRAPSPTFDPAEYLARHPDVLRAGLNPLEHFLSHLGEESTGLLGQSHGGSRDNQRFVGLYTNMLEAARRQPSSSEYIPDVGDSANAPALPVRVIAFYLPQFHPIPENDAWWGKGFTEWTNVTKAVPQFEGHFQPRLPDALGFYDLRLKEVQREQIALAKRYGVYGFCYHHYWFAGKRLLERPLQQMLDDPSLDFPFCICWANENWTRRWDGCDDEVLLGQNHCLEDDLAFLAELEPALRDPRYIRVDGRPLLIVYRPQLFPDPAATARHWREYARERGVPEPYLVNVWSFPEAVDPHSIGFDAAVEFPPHQYPCSEITEKMVFLNPAFDGRVCDYQVCVEHAEATRHQRRSFDLFPGVMTAWDNTPRRLEHGTVYANATPEAYRRWMRAAGERALDFPQPDQRMVFVNAWNEWAEGTYLEPDRRYGYAYLSATRDVVESLGRVGAPELAEKTDDRQGLRVLLIGHDAHRHGAQLLALSLARLFARHFGCDLRVWLLEGGDLVPDYQKVAPVEVIGQRMARVADELHKLHAMGFDWAITNTTVTGNLVPILKRQGFSVVSLVHEMPELIRERSLEANARSIAKYADYVVFAAATVCKAFGTVAPVPPEKTLLLPQGIYQTLDAAPDARTQVENEIGLPPDAILVINAGYGDQRKGFDWFMDCARIAADRDPRFHFLWVGKLAPDFHDRFENERRTGRLVTHLHQVPFTDSIARYFAAANVFLLTSREDPFPSVVLEALACGLPVVAFEGSGGHCELLRDPVQGALVEPMGDIAALAKTLRRVADDIEEHPDWRAQRAHDAASRFSFDSYGWALLQRFKPALQRVSVIVPNYNYAHYLEQRLATIFQQSYPVFEIIVLDDASNDDSLSMTRRVCERYFRDVRIIENTENSGSVFKQWEKGIRVAKGELIWIAEADDLAQPQFLERLVAAMSDERAIFAFTDSAQADQQGKLLGKTYATYCSEFSDLDFGSDFDVSAKQFLSQALGVKNNVLNVSAVVFRRNSLVAALNAVESELQTWIIAGDWRLYIELCKHGGRVKYVADALNIHRRHDESVVGSNRLDAHISEIVRIHSLIPPASATEGIVSRQAKYLGELTRRAASEGR